MSVCVLCLYVYAKQKREAFCQLLQLMKNKHSNQDEPDMISIFIGTWNMGQIHMHTLLGFSLALSLWATGLGQVLEDITSPLLQNAPSVQQFYNTKKNPENFLSGKINTTEVDDWHILYNPLWISPILLSTTQTLTHFTHHHVILETIGKHLGQKPADDLGYYPDMVGVCFQALLFWRSGKKEPRQIVLFAEINLSINVT